MTAGVGQVLGEAMGVITEALWLLGEFPLVVEFSEVYPPGRSCQLTWDAVGMGGTRGAACFRVTVELVDYLRGVWRRLVMVGGVPVPGLGWETKGVEACLDWEMRRLETGSGAVFGVELRRVELQQGDLFGTMEYKGERDGEGQK